MKIAFLDFEFGQIYGSYRRDFLVTQAGVLLYDTDNDIFKIAEMILKPDSELVMRASNGGKLKEWVINYHTKKSFPYDKKFKRIKNDSKKLRQEWVIFLLAFTFTNNLKLKLSTIKKVVY